MSTLPIKYPTDAFGSRPSWRGLLLLTLAVLAILALYYALKYPAVSQQEISQAQMFELMKEGRVVTLVNEPDASTGIRYLAGVYHMPVSNLPNAPETSVAFKVAVDLQLDPNLLNNVRQAGYHGTIETVNNTNIVWPLFLNLAPATLFLALMGCLVYRLFRAFKKAISG
jgi:hypothetical protein